MNRKRKPQRQSKRNPKNNVHDQDPDDGSDTYSDHEQDASKVVGGDPSSTDTSLISDGELHRGTKAMGDSKIPLPTIPDDTAASKHHDQQQRARHRARPPAGEYNASDPGPYVVLVASNQPEDGDGDPRNIGKLYPTGVGRRLKRAGLDSISVATSGRNQLRVVFASAQDANKALSLHTLADERWRSYIPSSQKRCQGIIRRVDPHATAIEFMAKATTSTDVKVVAAQRLQRRDVWDNTWKDCQTWRLTFDSPTRPKNVYLYGA